MDVRKVDDIEYQLLPGTDRRTTDIVIERDGTITVRPPKSFGPERIDAVVRSKRMWIYRNLAMWRDLNASAVIRRWVNGESFLYLGRTFRLLLVDNQNVAMKLHEGRFCLNWKIVEQGGTEAAAEAFKQYYCEKGTSLIQTRVDYFAPKAGVAPLSVNVKDLGYRWASCSAKGALSFHWKCMMAPLQIIDYIVVHELCHMHHRDHSDAFWNEVDKVMPGYRERKDWLKKKGASLDL
ncbi:MAG: M48 family metallopeptidase [Chitinispirillaceae bacterium]